MSDKKSRLPGQNRHYRTIASMVEHYRHKHRNEAGIDATCNDLLAYASQRIQLCPYGIKKPACSHCTIKCYSPDMKALVKKVMRAGGPYMLFSHPILSVVHLVDMIKNRPPKKT